MVILLILLINNFVFYRRKLKDDISLMIMLGLATCVFELLWAITDGVTEAHGPNGELYGDDRLMKMFLENIDNSEEEMIDAISNDIIKFSKGTAQFDDITMMVITIK